MPRRRAADTAAIRFDIEDGPGSLSTVTSAVADIGGHVRGVTTVRRIDGDPPLVEIELEVEGVADTDLVAALHGASQPHEPYQQRCAPRERADGRGKKKEEDDGADDLPGGRCERGSEKADHGGSV